MTFPLIPAYFILIFSVYAILFSMPQRQLNSFIWAWHWKSIIKKTTGESLKLGLFWFTFLKLGCDLDCYLLFKIWLIL